LAGFRITVGDDVYEDSIANRLRPLAAALSWIRFDLYLKIVT
jgi:F0F1-type ATP synthase delta subunit